MESLYERFEISRWIAADLAGTIADDEREKLRIWLECSPLHRQEYDEIRTSLKSGSVDFVDKNEVDRQWACFEKTVTPARKLRSMLKYAAAILLPLIAVFFMWERMGNGANTSTEQQDNHAVVSLVLEDGSRIWFDREGNRLISNSDGVMIALEDNVLIYDGSASSVEETSGQNTLYVPNGCDFNLQLADGTRVWLNAGSKLTYPRAFSRDMRQVGLEGEGYFEVSADKEKPFVVRTGGVEIMVLGTSFNVSSFGGKVETTLIEGSVKLTSGSEQVTLHPDQQAVWSEDSERFSLRAVDARNYTLWKDGIFWFDDARLDTIMECLSRWYDVEVVYKNPEFKNMRFSIEMKRYDQIETVLQIIKRTQRVDFVIADGTIEVL